MKTKDNILLLAMLLTSFALSSFSQTNNSIEGRWKEYWGSGEATDIDYHDIFLVNFDSTNIYIDCENRCNYEIRNIVFDGEVLSFELLNRLADDIIPYNLSLDPKDNKWLTKDKWLIGAAVDVEGYKTRVRWKRIPED